MKIMDIAKRHPLICRLYILAFLVSLGNWAVLGMELTPDTPSYIEPAIGLIDSFTYGERMSTGEFQPTAYRTPGTSLLIAPFYAITHSPGISMILTVLLFSALAPIIPLYAFLLARSVSIYAGYIGYLLMLLSANIHFNAISIMSDLPFAAFFALSNLVILLVIKHNNWNWKFASILGISVGLTTLIRPLGIYWAIGIFALLLIKPKLRFKKKIKFITISSVIIFCIVSPWLIRNVVTLGSLTMGTIKGNALIWSFGSSIGPPLPTDSQAVADAKIIIRKFPNNRMMQVCYSGYENTVKNQVEVCNTLKNIALDYYKSHPLDVYNTWKSNLINIYLSQTHYDSWMNKFQSSSAYRNFITKVKPYIPRIEIKLYHINLELKQLSIITIKYLFLPGLIILLILSPFIGICQLWNLFVISSFTALVLGYDRFRLPLDPIICACAGLTISTLIRLLGIILIKFRALIAPLSN